MDDLDAADEPLRLSTPSRRVEARVTAWVAPRFVFIDDDSCSLDEEGER